MTSVRPACPTRLADGNDRQAEVIRLALAEPQVGPSEQQSWQRLEASSQRGVARFPVPAVAVALVLAAFAAWLGRPHPELLLSPERLGSPAAAPRAPAVGLAAVAPSATAVANPERPKPAARASASGDGSSPDQSAAPCAKLAKSAEYAAATACYGRVARGGSMTSELALYEKARLEARALGNSARALSTLDEHRRRFPSGVLTSEVAFTRIDLLMQLGKRAEALAAIDQGLQSALGQERGADLQLMRAGLLAGSGDCAAALQAANAARKAGAHPSRLEAVEQRCAGSAPPAPAPEAP